MTWLTFCANCLIVFAFLFPIYSVLNWGKSGILFGTSAYLGSLVVAGVLLFRFDLGGRGSFASLMDIL
jgi:hypothetical protein